MITLYTFINFICIFCTLFGGAKNNYKSDPFQINSEKDYQRVSDIIDKIEILELIEDHLMPLTDNEILDSKRQDHP